MKAMARRALGLAVCATLFALPACSAIVGITDLPTGDGGASGSNEDAGATTLSDGAVVIAGGVPAFLGTWTITSGSNTVTCSGDPPKTTTDTGSVTLVRGTSSDLVTAGGCRYEFDVTSTDTATLLAGQACEGTETDGEVITLYPSGTFTLNAGLVTGTVSFTGTATDVFEGESVSCAFTETDQYAKN
jgi:hypothetical protein